jgi:uncharacterized protein involved in cysteine biosynthesis
MNEGPIPENWRGAITGAQAFVRGLKLVAPGGGLFKYAILPALASLVVLAGLVVLAWFLVHTWLGDWVASHGWWSGWTWIGGVLAVVLAALLAWFLFFPAMNLFAPLFLDPICEEVYRRHTGRELRGRLTASSFARRQWSALVQSLKIICTTAVIELPLAIFALLTTVGSIVAFPINGWLGGADLLDNPLALKHLTFRERLRFCARYKWATAGLGATAGLAMFVPVLNLLVVAAGTAGATLLVIQAEGSVPKGD